MPASPRYGYSGWESRLADLTLTACRGGKGSIERIVISVTKNADNNRGFMKFDPYPTLGAHKI